MTRRKIIKIDELLCNGCGNRVITCSECAIRIIDGKAWVVSDKFCDGLGACIGECPESALTIEEREAEKLDEVAAKAYLSQSKKSKIQVEDEKIGGEMQDLQLISPSNTSFDKSHEIGPGRYARRLGPSSQLSSWPIRMRLAVLMHLTSRMPAYS